MGGGGDGGYGARQDATDAAKARARAALNAQFGIAPTGDAVDPADSAEAAKNKSALDELYANTRSDAYNAGKRRVDEQRSQAGRDLKFELFARGLNGGSVDVDQNALLGRTYAQGLTDLGAKADAASADLRSQNEQARLQLLQSIDSGMDQGSALSSALGQMKVNSGKAAADAAGTSIGDLFSNAGLIYQQNKVSQGVQNALNATRGGYLARGSSGSLSSTG